jgi:hypothetical protein
MNHYGKKDFEGGKKEQGETRISKISQVKYHIAFQQCTTN